MKKIVISFLIIIKAYFVAGQIDTSIIDSGYTYPPIFCNELVSYEGAPYNFAVAVIEDIEKIRIESIQGKDVVFEMFVMFDSTGEKEQNDTIFFKYDKSIPVSIFAYTNDSSPLYLWEEGMTDGNLFLEKYNLKTALEEIERYLSHLKYYARHDKKFDDMNCSHEGVYIQCFSPVFFRHR